MCVIGAFHCFRMGGPRHCEKYESRRCGVTGSAVAVHSSFTLFTQPLHPADRVGSFSLVQASSVYTWPLRVAPGRPEEIGPDWLL